jgi:predicted O-methyltransferase YrrM
MRDLIHQQLQQAFSTEQRRLNWCIPPETGQFLAWLVTTQQAKTVLELGTSIGYSGLWLLRGMCQPNGLVNGHLHTLDVSEQRQQQAMANFTAAHVNPHVTLHTGEARDLLPTLALPSLDMVFMDAHKADYGWYVTQVTKHLRPGGVIVADNTTSHAGKLSAFFDTIQQLGWPHADLATLGAGLWVVTKPL